MQPEWERWVLQLADRDWQRAGEAYRALAAAGEEGEAAAMAGMRYADPRIRRACTGFMDHYGTDAAIPALLEALNDETPKVRREAVHALSCDRCKTSPLCLDTVPTLIAVIKNEPNAKIRCEAVYGLNQRPRDERAIPVLRTLLADPETPTRLRQSAHRALRHHDPEYRRQTDEAARARSVEKSLDFS